MRTAPPAWDPTRLWNKALKFSRRAEPAAGGGAEGTFFTCLALELLARSALAAIHPSLNADSSNAGAHILYACGISPRGGRPEAVSAQEVFARLEAAYPDFRSHRAVCEHLIHLRDEELHTGANPFDDLDESKWLADYYAAVSFLCDVLQRSMDEFLGSDAGRARVLIQARQDDRTAEVKGNIAGHRKHFDGFTAEEREVAAERATIAARFRSTRTAPCPSCGHSALLEGDELKRSEPFYSEGEIVVTVTYVTCDLKCLACGLHLPSLDECVAARVNPRFIAYETTTSQGVHPESYPKRDDL